MCIRDSSVIVLDDTGNAYAHEERKVYLSNQSCEKYYPTDPSQKSRTSLAKRYQKGAIPFVCKSKPPTNQSLTFFRREILIIHVYGLIEAVSHVQSSLVCPAFYKFVV